MLSAPTARQAALLLGALGIVSGLLSTYVPIDPGGALEIALFTTTAAPLYPAFYFGLVLCVGIFLWESRSIPRLLLVFVVVMIAWIAAYETAYEIDRYLERFRAINPPDANGEQFPYIMAVAGFVAGALGSFLTVVGVSIASRDFVSYASWSRTVLIGAAAGMLMQVESKDSSLGLLLLFATWQAVVAGSVAYGIVQPKRLRAALPR